MSTRSLYADTKVGYLLPSLSGSSTGDVIAVASVDGGISLGFQAGGGGGLDVGDLYASGESYTLPAIAGAPQLGKVLTNIGGQCVLTADSGLDKQIVYGDGDSYELPVLAAAANNQVMKNVGGALQFADAPVAVSQAALYGAGAPYKLPDIEGQNTKIMTVVGGQAQFTSYTGLMASQVWASAEQYRLPDITGAPIGAEIVSTGADALTFRLNPSVVLGVTLYGGTSIADTNEPFVLAPVSAAADDTVFSKQGTSTAWLPQNPGVQADEVWANPAAAAKIPDYTGAQPSYMFAVDAGETSWNAPPASIAYGDLWAAPTPNPTDNYTLPVLGTATQIAAVAAGGDELEFIPAGLDGTTSVTQTFGGQFVGGAATTPQSVTFSKTGKTVVVTLSGSEMTVPNSTTVTEFTMAPSDLGAISAYLPPDNTSHTYSLGALMTSSSDGGVQVLTCGRINTETGAFTFRITVGTFISEAVWLPAPASLATAFLGTWATA